MTRYITSIALLVLSFGCEGLENLDLNELGNLLGEGCEASQEGLSEFLEDEGALSAEIAEEGPYPMSIIVSQDSLNRMFAAVAEEDIDPIEIDLTDELDVGFNVALQVDPDLPLIQIDAVEDCPTCIVTDVAFGVKIKISSFTIGAQGHAVYQFPISIVPQGLDATFVYANFEQSAFQVLEVRVTDDGNFSIPFFDLSANDILELADPYIREYVNEYVTSTYQEVELFQLEPWEIGNGDVKLLGRGPILYPENRTLVLGIHTNLVRPLDSSVEIEPALPEGADIGMQFHPELVQAMVQRMMHEGHIEREYDQSGSTMMSMSAEEQMSEESFLDDEGFQVTLSTLQQSEIASGLLSAGFTMWQTEGSLCGSAELRAELGVSIGDGGVNLTAQEIRIERGEGVFGFLAETADQWLNSDFMRDVVDVSEFTLNYDELNLPGNKKAEMSAETFRLEIGGSGFNIFLNLDAVVDREIEAPDVVEED